MGTDLMEDRECGPWWMERCGCDYCWDNVEAFAPPAHRNPFDPWDDAPEDCELNCEGLEEPTLAGTMPSEADSSKHTCTCGKHGGMCKQDGCGSRSSKAYANSSSKVGRGHRQFLTDLM